jgi:hypothetical protein
VKNDRRVRRLVVGEVIWYWTVQQRVKPSYEDCRLTLSLYPEGTRRRRLALVFRPGQDRIISNSYFESGALMRLQDQAYLNLYEPGTVRRLVDAAVPAVDLTGPEQTTELDGWPYFDEVVGGISAKAE